MIKKIWNATFNKYKLSSEEKSFIKINKTIWCENKKAPIGIIVEGFLYSPTSVIEKARIAKAIEETLNVKSLVLLRGFTKRSSNVYPIYKSFSINNFIFWWAQYLNPILLIKVLYKTLKVYKDYPTGEKLLNLQSHGIVIGDLIYDSLIRSNPKSYTVEKLDVKKHFRHIFRALYSLESYKNIFDKYDIKAIVTSHNVYAEYGILCRFGDMYNADIYLKDMDVFKHYDGSINVNEHFLKVNPIDVRLALENDHTKQLAKSYLDARMNGSANQIDVKNAYRNKKTYSKSELLNYFHLDNDNKNVFILAHAFSDAPHVGEGLLFNDYYDWLKKTLKIIHKVEGLNIFVKPHPSSYMWNENGAVEELLSKLKIKNIYILPNNFNTNSIKDIADYVLTAQGTAGLEFSCFGIPAIIAGKGYYSGFGICIEPDSREEYENRIKNILEIERLQTDTIEKAVMILYLSFQHLTRSDILPSEDIFPGDEYDKKYKQQYQEVANKLKNGVKMKDDFYNKIKKIANKADSVD